MISRLDDQAATQLIADKLNLGPDNGSLAQRKVKQITVSVSKRCFVTDTAVKEGVIAFIAEDTKGKKRKQIHDHLANTTSASCQLKVCGKLDFHFSTRREFRCELLVANCYFYCIYSLGMYYTLESCNYYNCIRIIYSNYK